MVSFGEKKSPTAISETKKKKKKKKKIMYLRRGVKKTSPPLTAIFFTRPMPPLEIKWCTPKLISFPSAHNLRDVRFAFDVTRDVPTFLKCDCFEGALKEKQS